MGTAGEWEEPGPSHGGLVLCGNARSGEKTCFVTTVVLLWVPVCGKGVGIVSSQCWFTIGFYRKAVWLPKKVVLYRSLSSTRFSLSVGFGHAKSKRPSSVRQLTLSFEADAHWYF